MFRNVVSQRCFSFRLLLVDNAGGYDFFSKILVDIFLGLVYTAVELRRPHRAAAEIKAPERPQVIRQRGPSNPQGEEVLWLLRGFGGPFSFWTRGGWGHG